ncbi:caspase family protein [Deinococcus sp. 12RED42]|uniref:caspase family protein n=1 Tax=Deinococcus sp. 12RED42 TaxID=2745872 RepID=UPI001E430191|nr:caspase family protein [Deinococcus sp. 12RED42]MCD0164239.1 caspase family protein [Deinococcus sp. 12RED42]
MKSAAILIGLNSYPNAGGLAKLKGTINDCQDVAKTLLELNLIGAEHLYAYVFDETAKDASVAGAKPLINDKYIPRSRIVSRDVIASRLWNLIKELGNQGVGRLFVYLSGHGGGLTQAVPPVSAFLTADYEETEDASNLHMLVTDQIQNYVHNASKIKEAVIISDSCRTPLHAATVVPFVGPSPLFVPDVRCLTIKSAVHSEESLEEEVKGRTVGTFTRLLMAELKSALSKSGDEPVTWRQICDAVVQHQAGSGQRLDCYQATAYPLLEVRAAASGGPPSPPQNVAFRIPTMESTINTSRQRMFPEILDVMTMNSQSSSMTSRLPNVMFDAVGSDLDGARLAGHARKPMREYVRLSRENNVNIFPTPVTGQNIEDVRHALEQIAGLYTLPKEAIPEEIYRYRSLINGIRALHAAFPYLSSTDQVSLQRATLILASEGDPRALDRLNGTFSAGQWRAIMAFLRRQAKTVDPLAVVDAPAEKDGFALRITDMNQVSRNQVRVTLQVEGTGAKSHPSSVRVYQHPSLLPVIQDVAFKDDRVRFVLTIRSTFTVAVKVDGGPLLKLDLRTEERIPQRIRQRILVPAN